MIQTVDHLALLPGYVAACTAVAVLLVDLAGRRSAVVATAAAGAVLTGLAAPLASGVTFCVAAGCSWVVDPVARLTGVLFAGLTLAVLALSAPAVRAGAAPVGEYCFLLTCAMTGGVVVGNAGDLITLIVGLETLTLPLYLLVGLRGRVLGSAGSGFSAPAAPASSAPASSAPPSPAPAASGPGAADAGSIGAGSAEVGSDEVGSAGAGRLGPAAGAEAAVTFFVVSVVSTAVALLGAALAYAAAGTVYLTPLTFGSPAAPAGSPAPGSVAALGAVGSTLIVVGFAFKVAAVPLHAWAPVTYDGAPLPIAAYLSTASKLGGVVALLAVVYRALPVEHTGPVLAVLAVLTMTVGNLVALRQTRMVRLLAWSSVAQAGYILAPLAAVGAGSTAVTAALAYSVFFVVLELGAFASVIALRPIGRDGGLIANFRGAARRSPWVGAVLVLALAGLAGLPPGLAGLFAKVAVVRSLLGEGAAWLAIVVALNAVVALAYYIRVAATLYAAPGGAPSAGARTPAGAGPAAAAVPSGEPVPAAGTGAGAAGIPAAGVVPALGVVQAADAVPAAGALPEAVRVPWPVAVTLVLIAIIAILLGFAPQLVLDAATL
jgi:NADH-quinone oxidoreductase subunit N